MSAGSRIRTFARDSALPAFIAAVAATAVTGLADGAINTYSLLQALATAGFIGMIAVPAGFAVALVLRWLWNAWNLPALAAADRRDTGGVPRLAAWAVTTVVGLLLLAAISLDVASALIYRHGDFEVISALYVALMVVVGIAWVAVGLPAVDAANRGLSRADAWIHARLGRSLMTPRIVLIATSLAIAALLAWLWFGSIEPRIGFLDLTPFVYLGIWIGLIVAGLSVWPLLRRNLIATIATSAGVLALSGSTFAAAHHVRHNNAYAMLEVWGNTTWGGAAIDYIYNIQTLRRSLKLKGIKPKPRPGAKHPNVVLITIDTLRTDRTPPYGGPAKMPGLGKLARGGVVFEWAFSPGNVTRRSLPTIATGLSPHRVRGRVAGWALRMDPRHITLAERFRAAGYDTAGFLAPGSQFHPTHRLGLIRGLDHLHQTNLLTTKPEGDLGALARDWINNRADKSRPFFIWIHFIDPHLWHVTYKQAKFGRDLRTRYDRSLADVDASLRKLMTVLWTDELRANTVIAVSADHGEGLGDRGQRYHSTNLYNSQIHVPLIIAGNGIKPRRIRQSVGLVDLAPTLLDLAGFIPPGMPQMDGVSVAPVVRGSAPESKGEAYSAMVRDRSVKHGMRALVWGRYKLIQYDSGKRDELFDLYVDKRERRNLAPHKPALLKQLKRRLNERRRVDSIRPF